MSNAKKILRKTILEDSERQHGWILRFFTDDSTVGKALRELHLGILYDPDIEEWSLHTDVKIPLEKLQYKEKSLVISTLKQIVEYLDKNFDYLKHLKNSPVAAVAIYEPKKRKHNFMEVRFII